MSLSRSFAPKLAINEHSMEEETAPDGWLARGDYTGSCLIPTIFTLTVNNSSDCVLSLFAAKLRMIDDDKNVHVEVLCLCVCVCVCVCVFVCVFNNVLTDNPISFPLFVFRSLYFVLQFEYAFELAKEF